MLQEIPTLFDGTVAYRQRTRLGTGEAGQDWILQFRWNARTSLWYLTILDLESAYVVTGQAVTCEIDLLARAMGGPEGFLIAVSADGSEAPGLLELGDRVKLYFTDGVE